MKFNGEQSSPIDHLCARLCVRNTKKALLTPFLEEKIEAQENSESCLNSYKLEADSQVEIQRHIWITLQGVCLIITLLDSWEVLKGPH